MRNHSRHLLVLLLQDARSGRRKKEDRRNRETKRFQESKSWNKDTMMAPRRKEED
jgi:hypothetical protein